MTVQGRFFSQHLCQTGKCLLGVDRAGGIVGGIDQNRGSLFVKDSVRSIEVDLEVVLLDGHNAHFRAGAFDIGAILREKRSEDHDFLTRLCHTAEGMGNSTCRTGSRENMSCLISHIETLIQGLGDHLLDAGIAHGRIVSVKLQGLFLLQQFDRDISVAVRRRHRRIPETEIKYIFVSYFLSARGRVFRQFADHRLVIEHCKVFLIDHVYTSF